MKLLDIMRSLFGIGRGPAGAANGGAAPALPRVPVSAIGEVRVTERLLVQLGVASERAMLWAGVLDVACRRFDITSKKRLAMFLANVLHETGSLRRIEENLDYSISGLLNGFGRHRISAEDAQRLGRKVGQAALSRAQQDAIADIIYGGPCGREQLGNVEPHDGSMFRGRGLIQATGRAMYRKLAQAFRFGDELVVRDWLMTREGAALSAAWIWAVEKKCNPLADAGNVTLARKRINGGDKGLAEVAALYSRGMAVMP